MSILIAFFGIYLLFVKQYLRGGSILLGGIIWFFLATKVFIPYFAGPGHSFNYWSYTQLGPDLPSALVTMVHRPLFVISLLFLPLVKLSTLIKTFGIFLGLTFFSPLILLTIPLVLERFLSSTENYWQFNFHYGATLAPILVMAVADSLYRLSKIKKLQKLPTSVLTTYVTGMLAVIAVGLFLISPMAFIFRPHNYTLTSNEIAGYATLRQISDDTSVCTTNHIAPHLGSHELTLIGFDNSPTALNCDTIITSAQLDQSPALQANIANALAHNYHLVSMDDGWSLYKSSKE
jgi:uncharacterized membrane protein